MAEKRPLSADTNADTTQLTKEATPLEPPSLRKKQAVRSVERSVADYLQGQNRIGTFNDYPLRKHRYINLHVSRILDSLVVLYVHLFKIHWDKFSRSLEKFPLPTGTSDFFHYAAYTYISHWANDLYYSIRKSCQVMNPLAFVERYSQETGRYADRYDRFLTLLMNAIKPTPIVGAIADEIYIPILGKDIDFTRKKNVMGWVHWNIDNTIFQLIHQTLELKKVTTMVPTSDDPTGRPLWLFDWFDNSAYAWFPFDGNYNEIDISVAYILGVACTPKVSLPDTDEWRIVPLKTDPKKIDVNSYVRVNPRRRHGTSEHRALESEIISLPNYYEKDKDKFAKSNTGPIALVKVTDRDDDDDAESSEAPDPDYVPESPRIGTRSTSSDPEKALRVRVHDYIYHTQVIQKHETATRFAAFKQMMQPPA
ncbi:coat protein [Marigold cryptic virus]|nr:coat protein [Marigold cryptic virus]